MLCKQAGSTGGSVVGKIARRGLATGAVAGGAEGVAVLSSANTMLGTWVGGVAAAVFGMVAVGGHVTLLSGLLPADVNIIITAPLQCSAPCTFPHPRRASVWHTLLAQYGSPNCFSTFGPPPPHRSAVQVHSTDTVRTLHHRMEVARCKTPFDR
jgi:hypothetical protein